MKTTLKLRLLAGLMALWWAFPPFTESIANSQPRSYTPIFEEVSTKVGLNFRHFYGMTGKLFLPEVMGSGAALFDFDNDSDLDIFLVQGSTLESGDQTSRSIFPWLGPGEPKGRLFRNDLVMKDGKRSLQLTDVTDKSGIRANGYGMGVEDGVTWAPWELLVPYRRDVNEPRFFLGERFHVSRWLELGPSLYSEVPFGDLA